MAAQVEMSYYQEWMRAGETRGARYGDTRDLICSLGFSMSAYLLEGMEGAVCEHPHSLLLLLHLLGCSVTQV